jgi:hypothetical protein
MKHVKLFEEFINEDNQSDMLNEDASAAILLMNQVALLGILGARAGLFDPVGDWFSDKIDSIKSKIRRHKKMKMTNATYQEFADKIPQIYSELENNWNTEIVRLDGELKDAIAAKETYTGDKRKKEWTSVSNKPWHLQREIDSLKKKDFFKYIYTTADFMEKNKKLFPELDSTSSEQIQLLAKMIRDYVKDGKVKDSYWTERKN